MLLSLYNLINKSSNGRTPLEDFTTECFAGVLQQHPLVLETFTDWLNLPKGSYKVTTQCNHYLEDDMNCIIDLVLESNNVLCFIENKVNSKEGWEQLNRYTKVLDKQSNKQTFLKYCTKYVDSKKNKNHNFSQFRWHELAKLIEIKHPENPLVIDFVQFLKRHQMTQDTSITTDTVIAMNKFLQTYEAMNFHIINALGSFKKLFPKGEIVKGEGIAKIREHDRISRSIHRIFKENSKPSELMFAIYFEEVKIQTLIWVSIHHPMAEKMEKRAIESGIFKTRKNESGIGIYLDCKLYQFIENKNSDQEIKEWFENSFQVFRDFIDNNPDLEWDDKVLI